MKCVFGIICALGVLLVVVSHSQGSPLKNESTGTINEVNEREKRQMKADGMLPKADIKIFGALGAATAPIATAATTMPLAPVNNMQLSRYNGYGGLMFGGGVPGNQLAGIVSGYNPGLTTGVGGFPPSGYQGVGPTGAGFPGIGLSGGSYPGSPGLPFQMNVDFYPGMMYGGGIGQPTPGVLDPLNSMGNFPSMPAGLNPQMFGQQTPLSIELQAQQSQQIPQFAMNPLLQGLYSQLSYSPSFPSYQG